MEIWLTSEDTGAYGRDIGVSLPQLLWQLVDVIPDGCMLRLGMTNPPYILEHLQVCYRVYILLAINMTVDLSLLLGFFHTSRIIQTY